MDKENHGTRSFAWLNATQFFGALNDNVFRWLVVFFIMSLPQHKNSNFVVPLVTFIFVLPFLLFSHSAGVLADRFSKRTIIVMSKALEVGIMALGCVGIQTAHPPLLYTLIFLMCFQSTIFGPSKYGIIPELVKDEDLSKANGFMTGLSWIAIILGIFVPTYILKEVLDRDYLAVAHLCLVIAVCGLLTSIPIRKTPAAAPDKRFSWNFAGKIFLVLKEISKDKDLFLAVLGSVYFVFLGGFIQQNLTLFGVRELSLSPEQSGYLFPATALGIGLGGLLAGKLSGRNIEFGIVPIGAFMLTVCSILLHVIPPTVKGTIIVMFFVGIGGGLFIVPLNAFIQHKSPKDKLGEILACVNFFTFLGVAVSAGLIFLLTSEKLLHLSPSYCFLVCGFLTLILALMAIRVLPDFLVRFAILCITRIFYRIRTTGFENVPSSGPALLVCNHVTWVDALLLGATQQRRIRFVMSRDLYEGMWIRPLFKLMRVIPIQDTDPPRKIVASLREARKALDDGYLVCIFAEGDITRNGNMLEFKPGFERIVKNSNHPVIPVHIGGAWGSIFSYYYGKLLSRLPRSVPYNVTVSFGEPMPSSVSALEVRHAVLELSAHSFDLRKNKRRSLPRAFIDTGRRNWFLTAIADTSGKNLSFGKTLTSAIALGDTLKDKFGKDEKIGILLPSSVAGVLANLAVTLQGRVSVNLNFTASAEALDSAIRQCEIRTVISSKDFLDKLEGVEPPEGTIYLEDIIPGISPLTKIAALFKASVAPPSSIMCFNKPGPDNVATIIFSSGSTGEPKGVMLSHHNILSNVESSASIIHFTSKDRLCAILPFFHSFGYAITLCCPLIVGFSACYHPSPVDGTKIAELVREKKLSVLLATPTFLLAYIRRAKREDFESLRLVITGAEKLKKKVADTFEDRFGLRPVEGYGATELSPVAALNVPDVTVDGRTQVGTKANSVGHPLPGIVAKVVDPDTREPLGENTEGLLLIKGPNVMLGYLNQPEKTDQVLNDGWYDTGDIARIDRHGFVYLLDRVSRYSKIGGEMVPHVAVEEVLMKGLNSMDRVVFVAGAPDEKRGEQMIVLYTPEAGESRHLVDIIKNSDLPNLWKPKKDNYLKIESMPTLGSGKLDLKKLKSIAHEFAANKPGIIKRTIDKIRDAL